MTLEAIGGGKKRKLRGLKDCKIPTVVRYLSGAQYSKIVKHRPVRILVNGVFVELRQRDEETLRQIEEHKAKIKELKAKLK